MKLKVNLQRETIANLPLRKAIKVDSHTLLRSVVARLRSHELGCAIVVDTASRPIGMFSERTLIRLLAQGIDLDTAAVGDNLDGGFEVVKETDPIAEVFRAINQQGLRFFCVVNASGEVVGLTGQRGLAEYISEHYPQQVMVQRLGGKPIPTTREGA